MRGLLAPARLPRGEDAARAERGALAHLGPLRQLPREHVLHEAQAARPEPSRRACATTWKKSGPMAVKPMNCPGHCSCTARACTPQRVPAAHRGDGSRAPARAVGRAPRLVPRAGVHPGRRAPLLHARTDRERDRDADRRSSASCTRRSTCTTCGSSCRTRPEKSIGCDEMWEQAEGALRARARVAGRFAYR